MNKLSFIRFGSYVVIVGIAILLRHQIGVIPVLHLSGFEEVQDFEFEAENRKSDQFLVGSSAFRESTLSGSEVLSIANETAKKQGEDLSLNVPQRISIVKMDGKIVWFVQYDKKPSTGISIPMHRFQIRVEDATGDAKYENNSANM